MEIRDEGDEWVKRNLSVRQREKGEVKSDIIR